MNENINQAPAPAPSVDQQIQDRHEATDILAQWQDEPMSDEDKATFNELVAEHKEHAAAHVSNLMDKNKIVVVGNSVETETAVQAAEDKGEKVTAAGYDGGTRA